MAAPTLPPAALPGATENLADLSLDELKVRFLELKGVPLPKYMRRGLMTLAVAHAMREAATGGLDRDTQRQLDALVRQIVPTGERKLAPPNRKIKAGTRLLREWQGRVHEVTVVKGGFTYEGGTYRSLSEIARTITGTRWNGWTFFGLKKAGSAAAAPAERKSGRRAPAARAPLVRQQPGAGEVRHA